MVRPEAAVCHIGSASGNASQCKYSLRPSTISNRKRDAEESTNTKRSTNVKGNTNGRQKRLKPDASVEEDCEWEHQYWQGKSIFELSGMGCGWCRFISPFVPSQSPIDGQMWFEVMSGTEGHGNVPVAPIEQIIVLQNPSPSVPKTQAYRIIIVPTAASGSSPILRRSPDIVSFDWPDKKADKHLKGQLGEDADQGNDTYLSVVKRVFNEQLAAFGKSVTGVSDRGEEDSMISCITTLSFKRMHENEENIKGRVYFLDTGLLFSSQTRRLYLSFESLSQTILVLARDLASYSDGPALLEAMGRPVSLEVHISASEPYYKTRHAPEPNAKENIQDSILLNFTKMPVDLLDKVRAYASKHSIHFKECRQLYYDFAKNLMMTGWLPLKIPRMVS
ncbi:hypothetical protein MMC17_005059 [Xylographa soralifera]|nr:hypothetical protein [Xylographa soralifera]